MGGSRSRILEGGHKSTGGQNREEIIRKKLEQKIK
jgi:hypothetical protein